MKNLSSYCVSVRSIARTHTFVILQVNDWCLPFLQYSLSLFLSYILFIITSYMLLFHFRFSLIKDLIPWLNACNLDCLSTFFKTFILYTLIFPCTFIIFYDVVNNIFFLVLHSELKISATEHSYYRHHKIRSTKGISSLHIVFFISVGKRVES